MNPLNDPKWVSKTPIATVFLLEGANIGQIWRMWTQHSSLGQNVGSWFCVGIALVLWFNFYRVICPKEKFAKWATAVGIGLNTAVWLSVLYFQMLGK